MARRKRASMREGPLADLFRSTARDGRGEQAQAQPSRVPSTQAAERRPPTTRPTESRPRERRRGRAAPIPSGPPVRPRSREPTPPDPERVRAYRVEEPSLDSRSRRSGSAGSSPTTSHDVEGPAYGRDEPGHAATTTARRARTCR